MNETKKTLTILWAGAPILREVKAKSLDPDDRHEVITRPNDLDPKDLNAVAQYARSFDCDVIAFGHKAHITQAFLDHNRDLIILVEVVDLTPTGERIIAKKNGKSVLNYNHVHRAWKLVDSVVMHETDNTITINTVGLHIDNVDDITAE